MGLYVRKSVSVGPFRVNFSSSGIGVSAGIKGLRVGTGPRGNYITVGRGGIYYRATLPSLGNSNAGTGPRTNGAPPAGPFTPSPKSAKPGSHWSAGPMVSIDSAHIGQMQDASSKELLDELNSKSKRPRYWIPVAILGMGGLYAAAQTMPNWAVIICAILLVGIVAYIAVRDNVAKTVVLGYQLDAPTEQAYLSLHRAFEHLALCNKGWRIDARGSVLDPKYQAGASSLVDRKGATFGKGLPPYVKSNIDVPFIRSQKSAMYFMPEHLLVYTNNGFGAIAYGNLNFTGVSQRFIESGPVPRDAQIVDKTWRYVNKKGGPDRRFNNNRELPIALYEELRFQSASGLNEVFQASRASLSAAISQAIAGMRRVRP